MRCLIRNTNRLEHHKWASLSAARHCHEVATRAANGVAADRCGAVHVTAQALRALHSTGRLHGDVHAGNIKVDDATNKVGWPQD